MGVKVTVRDGETIAAAIKRFRYMVRRYGVPGTNVKRPKWHKNQLEYYLKLCQRRRRDALKDEWQTLAGECARRRLMCERRRGAKRRKIHFGGFPIVFRYPPR